MTNKEFKKLKEINNEQAGIIENRISEAYKQSKKANVADGLSVGLFCLGFVIGITLQNVFVLSNSGKRHYKFNWLIALLGFNIFWFLYIGEQKRYDKYFDNSLSNVEIPLLMKEFEEGYSRVKKLTNAEIDFFRINNLYTTDRFKKIFKPLGMVYGSSVKAKHATADIKSGIKNIKGGKLEIYTKLMSETRNDALDSLIINATRNYKDFDAICNIRMATTTITGGASEVLVYGTVIKF
ncbi:MAG: heavy metal-binding domain-containing protein [Mycoplasmataceae bacterium]|nr:heavy metal-binding domain-containing protein [Mycoplasmataceae bacterium]